MSVSYPVQSMKKNLKYLTFLKLLITRKRISKLLKSKQKITFK